MFIVQAAHELTHEEQYLAIGTMHMAHEPLVHGMHNGIWVHTMQLEMPIS